MLNNLGVHAYYEGRWDGVARRSIAESRAAKELVGDVIGAAVQMNNEAEILSDQGHLDEALPLFDDWLRACRASGYAFGVGVALSNLGRVAARGSRFADAYGLFDDALDQFAQLSSERFANETRARMAECLVIEGSHARALELGLACREAARKSPVGGLEALIERTIGYALCQARRRDEATPHFEESLRLAREQKAEFEVALTLRAMASVGWDGADEPARGERRDPRAARRRVRSARAAAVAAARARCARLASRARLWTKVTVSARRGSPSGRPPSSGRASVGTSPAVTA